MKRGPKFWCLEKVTKYLEQKNHPFTAAFAKGGSFLPAIWSGHRFIVYTMCSQTHRGAGDPKAASGSLNPTYLSISWIT